MVEELRRKLKGYRFAGGNVQYNYVNYIEEGKLKK